MLAVGRREHRGGVVGDRPRLAVRPVLCQVAAADRPVAAGRQNVLAVGRQRGGAGRVGRHQLERGGGTAPQRQARADHVAVVGEVGERFDVGQQVGQRQRSRPGQAAVTLVQGPP